MNKLVEGFQNVTITPPNFQSLELVIEGTAPLVMQRFAAKAEMMAKMAEGGAAKNKKNRPARDFAKDAENATHYSDDGWIGFPASAFRASAIRACSLVAFKMTMAKMSIFVNGDGIDREDGTPLVRIYGKHTPFTMYVRNATGVIDIRSRPMFKQWAAKLKIEFDADQFGAADVINLFSRCGRQAGIGAGRPNSTNSCGLGWGTYRVVASEEVAKVVKSFKMSQEG